MLKNNFWRLEVVFGHASYFLKMLKFCEQKEKNHPKIGPNRFLELEYFSLKFFSKVIKFHKQTTFSIYLFFWKKLSKFISKRELRLR